MPVLTESFSVPNGQASWAAINDLNKLIPCVPGAKVIATESPTKATAEITVKMGSMGMVFTGPVEIVSTSGTTAQDQGEHQGEGRPEQRFRRRHDHGVGQPGQRQRQRQRVRQGRVDGRGHDRRRPDAARQVLRGEPRQGVGVARPAGAPAGARRAVRARRASHCARASFLIRRREPVSTPG